MEDLRTLLGSRPPMKRTSDGNIVWQDLVKRLRQLEQKHEDHVADDVMTVSNEDLLTRLTGIRGEKIPSPESAVATCLEALRRAVDASSEPPHIMLNSDVRPLVEETVSALHKLHLAKSLPIMNFLREFLTLKNPAPVELLWKLHKMDLMQVTTFVSHWGQRNGHESHLPYALLWLLTHPDHADMARDILIALLQTVQHSPMGCGQLLASSSVALLQNFSKQVVHWILNQPPLLPGATDEDISLSQLSPETLSRFVCKDNVLWLARTLLLELLSERVDLPTTSSLCSVVRNQSTHWTLEATPKSLINILSMVVHSLQAEELVPHIAQAGVKPNVNWRITLLLTTMLLKTFPEAADKMKQMIEELLKRGLEGGRQSQLIAAFLFARQCCYCQCPGFGTYTTWFSVNFGPDSTTAHNPKHFTLLLKLLTELVPAETADTLRVHLNKVPQAPVNCHSLLHDYSVLAKTRLADLNESAELPCLFADSRQVALPGMDTRKTDVLRVLEHFRRTKEVIKPVIEAAIFRRQYYREVFLVELLGFSGSSDSKQPTSQISIDETLRHEFISKLHGMRKIPDDMFKEYNEKLTCKQQTSKKNYVIVEEASKGPEKRVEGVGEMEASPVNEIEKQKKKNRLQIKPRSK